MKKESFETWLKGNYTARNKVPNIHHISNQLSRCGRLEKCMRLDLDQEYLENGGNSLMEKLQYSAEDQASGKPAPDGIIFKEGADIRNGMASLRSAARDYFRFCRSFK